MWADAHGRCCPKLVWHLNTPTACRIWGERFETKGTQKPYPLCIVIICMVRSQQKRLSPVHRMRTLPASDPPDTRPLSGLLHCPAPGTWPGAGLLGMCILLVVALSRMLWSRTAWHGSWTTPILLL